MKANIKRVMTIELCGSEINAFGYLMSSLKAEDFDNLDPQLISDFYDMFHGALFEDGKEMNGG